MNGILGFFVKVKGADNRFFLSIRNIARMLLHTPDAKNE